MGFVKQGTVYIQDDTDPEYFRYELRLDDDRIVSN